MRYRPGYPEELVATLQAECGLSAGSRVADVGPGTGLLALPFLRLGCRLLSSSYVPEPGAPGYTEMLAELERIFNRHAQDGRVAFAYDTRLFFDRLS